MREKSSLILDLQWSWVRRTGEMGQPHTDGAACCGGSTDLEGNMAQHWGLMGSALHSPLAVILFLPYLMYLENGRVYRRGTALVLVMLVHRGRAEKETHVPRWGNSRIASGIGGNFITPPFFCRFQGRRGSFDYNDTAYSYFLLVLNADTQQEGSQLERYRDRIISHWWVLYGFQSTSRYTCSFHVALQPIWGFSNVSWHYLFK